MRPLIKKISLSLLIVLYLGSGIAYSQVNTTERDEKRLEDISTKIQINKRKLRKKKKKKKTAQRNLSQLKRELKYLNRKLRKTKSELKIARLAAKKTKQQLKSVRAVYNKKRARFTIRIRRYYQAQSLAASQLWMFYEDAEDISDQSYMFERILNIDAVLIKELKESKAALEREKKVLEQQTNRISALRSSISKKESKIAKKSNHQKRFIGSLKREIAKIERQNRELAESSQQIASFIRKLGKGGKKFFGTGRFTKPTKGWLSSRFGYRYHPIFRRKAKHNGIDLAAASGTKIRAADSGIVIVAGRRRKYRGYGKVTVIDHGRHPKTGRRVSTVYAHQSRILIKKGDFVVKGDEIGWVGSTGYSTGPHLHFEVRENGQPVNPLKYLKL